MATSSFLATATTPSVGLVTWNSEGTEGGTFHSRKLHVPTDGSGLTLGRGYDMKEREPAGILEDLSACDVLLADAKTLSKAAKLSGQAAKDFVVTNKLEKFEISKLGQRLLFDRTYAAILADVKRICAKVDLVDKYGAFEWAKLDPAIAEILVDLRFRGDYTPESRKFLQPLVVKNDLVGFAAAMKKAANWVGVPLDRFKRRHEFLAAAVAARKTATKPPVNPKTGRGSTMPVPPPAWVSRTA
ncbi:MAG TPA: hypothetical protein PK306_22905 [Aquabacterium sp.]|nr:hypothetical protein [Aquabacterium sp.]